MLKFDPRERWTPGEAREHPFIKGLPLVDGQPWVPARHRVLRSRPVGIQIPRQHEPSPVDNFYAASAPNFNAKGRLAMNVTWGTGAGGQPPPRGPVHAPYLQNPPGALPYSYEESAPPPEAQAFAPGSYVPTSTLSMYAPHMSVPSHPNYPSSSRPSSSRRGQPAVAPGSYTGGSHNPYLYGTQSPVGDHRHRASGGHMASSPSGMMSSLAGTPPMYNSSLRQGPMRRTGSRDSMPDSLRMSASRESLGFARVPSLGDMGDDTMFMYASDEEALSPGQGAYGSSQASLIPPSAALGVPSGGLSASLPPTGPRLFSQGRHGPTIYSNPSSNFVFPYTGRHQSQPYNPNVEDMGLTTVQAEAYRISIQSNTIGNQPVPATGEAESEPDGYVHNDRKPDVRYPLRRSSHRSSRQAN
ncbi:Serine/threonine protein kinase [Gracilaria domingensis]|nr:Serine/threonine protein kinase [Gracilaria domingensis]